MKTKKIKTFVLTVSRNFPMTHPRKGEPTYFECRIKSAISDDQIMWQKKHTCRGNYPLWKKRIEQVQAGEAILSIRYWSGRSYNSKQVEIYQLDKDSGIGVQDMEFLNGNILDPIIEGRVEIETTDLCKNDGLSFQDFKDWFKGYNLSEPMAIIWFCNQRY